MMTLKPILNDALQFFVRNLGQIFTLCMPFLLIGSVINHFILIAGSSDASSPTNFFVSLAVNMALYPLYTGALILMMAGQANNRIPTNSELIASALGIYPRLLLLGIIGRTLIMLGFILFVLPGIWLSVRLAFSEFLLVIERLDPQAAIVKSFLDTRPHFLLILTALALIALPVFVLLLLTGNALHTVNAHQVVMVAAECMISFVALFLDVVMFRIFMEAGQTRASGAVL